MLLSAHHFEVLTRGRIAGKTADLDEATLQAILNSKMDPKHDHLNDLLDDEK